MSDGTIQCVWCLGYCDTVGPFGDPLPDLFSSHRWGVRPPCRDAALREEAERLLAAGDVDGALSVRFVQTRLREHVPLNAV